LDNPDTRPERSIKYSIYNLQKLDKEIGCSHLLQTTNLNWSRNFLFTDLVILLFLSSCFQSLPRKTIKERGITKVWIATSARKKGRTEQQSPSS